LCNIIYTVEFKEDILQLKDQLAGMRMLYANDCKLDTPNVILTQRHPDPTSTT